MSTPLPAKAATKLDSLSNDAEDAKAVVNGSTNRIRELEYGLFNNPNGDHADEWGQEKARLSARLITQQGRKASLEATVTAIRTWLNSQPANIVFEVIEPPAFELKDGETIADAIESLRGQINATLREQAKVRNAGLPVDEIKKQAAQYVDTLAQRGRPSIRCDHTNPDFNASLPLNNWDTSRTSAFISLAAWLDPQRLLSRLNAQIDADAAASDQLRLTATERSKLLVAMAAVVDDLERQEEALIERAADAGQLIERRHDASPAAILGIKASRKAKVAA